MKLLIADGFVTVNNRLERYFKQEYEECTIDQSFSLQETREKIEKEYYDFILIDCLFSDGNAESLIREQIRKHKFIILATEESFEKAKALHEEGAYDYYFKTTHLKYLVHKIIEKYNFLEQNRNTKVLFVNNIEAHKPLIERLKLLYFKVTVTDSLNEAQNRYIADEHDLKVIDFSTISFDEGIELINAFRSYGNFMPVVAIVDSSYSENDELKLLKNGIDSCVRENLSVGVTIEKFITLLETYKLSKQLKIRNSILEKVIKQQTKEMMDSFTTDKLTGLSNFEKLELSIDQEKILIVIDITSFHRINSVYGYSFGNRVLKEFAEYLLSIVPQGAETFRYHNDMFAFLLHDTSTDTETVIKQIKESLQNFYVNYSSIKILFTYKIIAVKGSKNNIFERASTAIDILKENNQEYLVYEDDKRFERKQKTLITWINKSINSVKEKKIEPFFQAIIDNRDQSVVKYEILARIVEGDQIIAPYFFIEPSKKAGILTDITQIIIEKALSKIATSVRLSLNVTDTEIFSENFLRYLIDMCHKFSFPKENITLEVLESFNANSHNLVEGLKRFKDEGFLVAIDDFGTGSSNFERVAKLSPDFIKIDGSFIKNIHENETDKKIVTSIVEFSKAIGAKTIAEYVKDEATFHTVKSLGIDYSQGFYFHEPSKGIIT